MQTSKVTSKYQATIPKEIRTKLNLQAGDNIAFSEVDGQIIISKVEPTDWNYLQSISGILEPEWLSDEDEQAYADL